MTNHIHPRLRLTLEMAGILAEIAESAARGARRALRPTRRGYAVRHPGPDSPLWNACAALLAQELAQRGAKARLARYLGIPRQRLQDFIKARSRLPDAEMTLQMVNWLAAKRAGTDVAGLEKTFDVTQ